MTTPSPQAVAEIVENQRELIAQLRQKMDHASYVKDGYVRVRDPDWLLAQMETAAAFLIALQGELDAAREALHQIAQWADAYPIDVFPEPDWQLVKLLLGSTLLSQVSASNMRHVIEGVGKIARAATGKPT